ncbi:polar amino acid transport system substrate-binding protein [Crenobacter luteus]|uniref:substrate-binding periplasmic protein n=1 Tax=Crenobacter luteus TaxID=1452487 RepID=UPI0010470404|nr:transporter substrate-binding domain-containing protein [Crenobacter luteus]TCP15164.1 polar amino acid transport system substrate-binding protein [Crenobacter luteus]
MPHQTLLFAAALVAQPAAAEPLTLHYFERPPFYYTRPDGLPTGLVIEPLRRALVVAGVAHRWQTTPSNRQLAKIEADKAMDCGVGWFRTPERERVGRFSAPLYRDRPQVVVVDATQPVHGSATLARLLAERDWVFLRRERFSYGNALDAMLAANRPREIATSEPIAAMVRMIAAGRASYTFVSAEEAGAMRQDGVRVATPPDMPAGETRHLWCSRRVPAETLARLDAALARLADGERAPSAPSASPPRSP